MYPIWIHESDFINMIPTWMHIMNSLLKIDENSIFWIHSIESSSEKWHLNSLKRIQKKQNLDFCYEFIHEMNIYEFTNLISWENLWFRVKSTQQQLNTTNLKVGNVSPIDQSGIQLCWESASIAAAIARLMSWINLETNKGRFYR